MDIEKYNAVLDYFEANEIEMSIEIKNSIKDAFEENDTIDSVECYFREDSETFAKDITLTKRMVSNLDGGSEGETVDVYSYYGDPEFVVNEHIELVRGDESVVVLTDIDNEDLTDFDREDFVVLLFEKHKWSDKEHNTELTLLIYCPKESPDNE